MNNIIEFQEKKDDLELLDLLNQYCKLLPTLEDIEYNEKKLCDKLHFSINYEDPAFVYNLEKHIKTTFENLCITYDQLVKDKQNDFLRKQYSTILNAYIILSGILTEYISVTYEEIQDTTIPELENILNTFDITDLENNTLKFSHQEYVILTQKIYNIFFRILELDGMDCKSLIYYDLLFLPITYYHYQDILNN